MWAEAERDSVSIPYEKERAEALTRLAIFLSQVGQQESSQQLWAEAERVSLSLEQERDRAEALSELAHGLIQQQQWAEAERVSRSIPDTLQSARALIALATTLHQAGLEDDGLRVLEIAERVSISIADDNSDSTGLKTEVLLIIARFFVLEGRMEDARRVQAEADLQSTLMDDVLFGMRRIDALKALASAFVQQQQWAEAEQVCASIPNEYQQVEALIALATALQQAGRQEDAQRVWTEAARVSTSIPREYERAEALIALGTALQQAGLPEEARRMWAEAEQVIDSISVEKRGPEAWEAFVSAFQQAQQQARLLIALATALHEAGLQKEEERVWAKAEQVSATLPSEELSRLATALHQAGLHEDARRMWMEAERVSTSIPREYERAEALIALATSFTLAGQREEAWRVWTEAERVRRSSRSAWETRSEKSEALATAFIQQQQWAEAEQVILSHPDYALMAKLARALAQQHYWEDAERVSAFMPYWESDRGTLTNLAAELAAQGEDERQLRLVQRWWPRAIDREQAIQHLPLAYGLLPRCPELAVAFSDAFTWVDTFLQG
jgi:tetratricopeptide (TPR) repeat protein